MKNYNIKKSSVIKELNLSTLIYETYGKKPQEIMVSEEQLTRIMEKEYNEQLTPPMNPATTNSEDFYTDMTVTNEEEIFDDYRHERPSYEKGKFSPGYTEDQSEEGFKEDEIGAYLNMDKLRGEISEDSEGEETYNYDEDLYHDKGELADLKKHHDDLHRIDDLEKDMDYDDDRGVGKGDKWRKEAGTDFKHESIDSLYHKSNLEQLDLMIEGTFTSVRKSIIKERITRLNRKNYILTEQSEWSGGRNPGASAASGIENIIANLKKAWAFVKDDKTRKQIMNTLTKLNNFMTYTAELIGSGEKQSKARGYDQVTDPIPYPNLDEPEELEDIDDGLEDFDEEWRNEEGKQYHNKNNR